MAPEKRIVTVKDNMSIVNRLEKGGSGKKTLAKKNPKYPNYLHIRMARRPT